MSKILKEDKYFIFDTPVQSGFKYRIHQLKNTFKAGVYKLLMNTKVPKRKVEPKYNVTIAAIFKNEGKYLKEWIEYHKIVGVEHFYLYNNNSEDNYDKILEPYIKEGLVTLVDWPMQQGQNASYLDCIEKYGNETRWLGFIDLDEFIVPKSTNDIYSFLKPFEKNRPAVLIYWKMFGASGKLSRDLEGLVTEDLTVAWKKPVNIGKCFLNTKYMIKNVQKNDCLNHIIYPNISKVSVPPVNIFDKVVVRNRHIATSHEFPIQINHYFSKTYEEYNMKKARGDAFFAINPRDEEYFYEHEMNNETVDYSAYKYLVKLKNNMKNFIKEK